MRADMLDRSDLRAVVPAFVDILRLSTVALAILCCSGFAEAMEPRLPDDQSLSPPVEGCGNWLDTINKPNDATTQWLLQYWSARKFDVNSFGPFLRERISRLDSYDQEFVNSVERLCSENRDLYFVNAVLRIRDQFRDNQLNRVLGAIVSISPALHPAPKYPDRAKEYQGFGRVFLYFTIEPNGSVSNPEVIEEQPPGYGFGAAALAILPRWKFPPQIQNGERVATGATYNLFILPP